MTTLFVVTFGSVSRAELPPWVYKQMQQKAPEALLIQVNAVQTKAEEQPDRKLIRVNADARVQEVSRTQTGLKQGAVIQIRYEHSQLKKPIPGAGQIPILQTGQILPAYLRQAQNPKEYTPAAGALSFKTIP